MVEYLLQYRLRFDIKDTHNNTPEELARKLGYDQIADYLSETCRLTTFLSREVSFLQQRPITHRTKTANTKSNFTILSSFASLSEVDSTELYNLTESRIEAARTLNDWHTVAALRSYERNSTGKSLDQLREFCHEIKNFY